MSHYSFDEIADFIYDKNPSLEKVMEINKHLYSCNECRKTYEAILEVYDAIEEWNRVYSKENAMKIRLVNVANRIKASNQRLAAKIYEMAKEIGRSAQNLALQIPSLSEIEAFAGDVMFQHPQLAVVTKSTATVTPVDEYIKSQVIDFENSRRVSIEEDGSLTMYLPLDAELLDREVILISDDESDEVISGKIKKYSEKEMYVCIDDVRPGKYMIFW